MSQAKWIERSLYPWAVVCQTVPILATGPAARLLVRLRVDVSGNGAA